MVFLKQTFEEVLFVLWKEIIHVGPIYHQEVSLVIVLLEAEPTSAL